MSKSKSKGTQPTISTFFSEVPSPSKSKQKRKDTSPIDLTLSDDEPPAKRSRTVTSTSDFLSPKTLETSRHAEPGPSHTDLPIHGAAEQWRFDPSSQEVEAASTIDQTAQRKQREKAQKILLGKSNFFQRDREILDANSPTVDDGADITQDKEDTSGTWEDDTDDTAYKDAIRTFTKVNKGPLRRNKSAGEIGPSGQPYTPMELQVKKLQVENPGTILMVESGYKIYFYGEDAKIASREFGIVCFVDRNFHKAMIPIHRRDVYIKKLISQGFKVGMVEQMETAALKKVSESRNELFERKLTHLYTATTYVDEIDSVDDIESTGALPLMCFVEELRGGMGADEKVCIGMVVISPSTGDVIWDEFEDNHMRTELETRMVHVKPYELLLPAAKLSKPSEKTLVHCIANSKTDHKIREERFTRKLSYTEAFDSLTEFYTDKSPGSSVSENFKSGKLMAAVTDFPKQVVIALAHAMKYLSSFGLQDALRETQFFAKFTERTHMLLNGNTLTNLEIYRNETDFNIRGSLMWILDHTTTKFGARLLKSWVGRPLIDRRALQLRIDAVEEIVASTSPKLLQLRTLLKCPDLAKGLCRIQYGKCTPQELATLLSAFAKVGAAFAPIAKPDQAGFKSPLLNEIIATLPTLKQPIAYLNAAISKTAALAGRKDMMWTDPERYPNIDATNVAIQIVETELMDELHNIRRVLKKPAQTYSTCMGEEYVIEVKKDENRIIPATWNLVSSTKTLKRYRTPEVRAKLQTRAQYKEVLEAEAQKAYQSFLAEIAQDHYVLLRNAVNKLAVADCLISLAQLAVQPNYVKPQFTDADSLEIVEGRHPMVEALRSDPFVPNSVRMGGGEPRSKVITGPNMGGKSSVVRMIALCAIMAQAGSYVPAKSMKIGMLDGIFTRMGASDELTRGRSTFMVEMQETSEILQMVTSKTLVILDELGRGTSTFDGMAIASATLQELVQRTKCKTLFITHYPQVALDLERKFPDDLQNLHMGFAEDTRVDGTREVTFLYRLTNGIAVDSFGVECARLAGLPESLLQVATARSQKLQQEIEERVKRNRYRKCIRLLHKAASSQQNIGVLEELRALMESFGI